jgi:glycerophosphoryl diester phosphodiesterase
MHKPILFLLITLSFKALAIDWQGHRGARGLYPENTIGAMEVALKYPISTLELDVVISKDNKVVLSHEPWINPKICKGEKKNLYKLTYDEIIKFDCGSKGHPDFPQQKKASVGKPLLSKLLNEFKNRDVKFNVEIKSSRENEKKGFQPDFQKFSDLVVKELREKLSENRFTIQSFDWRVLKYIHEKYPSLNLVALKEGAFQPESVLKELGFSPYAFSPYYKFLSSEDIVFFHKKKVLVIPWTLNSVTEMKALIKIGVDGIITDYPNLIPEALEKSCPLKHNLFEGECVRIPTHGVSSSGNPGWECKPGYRQKRSKCVKIKLPKNSHLDEEGRNWVCDKGYEPYRATCRKK